MRNSLLQSKHWFYSPTLPLDTKCPYFPKLLKKIIPGMFASLEKPCFLWHCSIEVQKRHTFLRLGLLKGTSLENVINKVFGISWLFRASLQAQKEQTNRKGIYFQENSSPDLKVQDVIRSLSIHQSQDSIPLKSSPTHHLRHCEEPEEHWTQTGGF